MLFLIHFNQLWRNMTVLVVYAYIFHKFLLKRVFYLTIQADGEQHKEE